MSVRLFLSTKVLHKTFLGSSETSCTFKSSIEKHFLGTAKAYALIALSKQPSCSSSPSGLTVPEGFDASSRIHHRTDTGTPRFTTHLKLKKTLIVLVYVSSCRKTFQIFCARLYEKESHHSLAPSSSVNLTLCKGLEIFCKRNPDWKK